MYKEAPSARGSGAVAPRFGVMLLSVGAVGALLSAAVAPLSLRYGALLKRCCGRAGCAGCACGEEPEVCSIRRDQLFMYVLKPQDCQKI